MQNSYSNENYAGFWVRLAAYVIDSVIVAIGLLVVRLASVSYTHLMKLSKQNRQEDSIKALEDLEYRKKLYEEFGI